MSVRLFALFIWVALSGMVLSPSSWGAEFAGGAGTQESPWKIKTRAHLTSLTNYLGTAGVGKYFALENDIVFSEDDFKVGGEYYNKGNGWVPVGHRRVANKMFKGNLDGQGFAVRNLFINRPNTEDVGLFGYTESALISNLRVESLNFTGSTNVGGLVGADQSSRFVACSSSGKVTGNKNVGGLIGYTSGATFSRSGADCQVSSSLVSAGFTDISSAGGMLGYGEETQLDECYALGSVTCATSSYDNRTSGYAYSGGLIGYLNSGEVRSSLAKGNVYAGTTEAVLSGDAYAGGLVGYLHLSSVESSYALGTISVDTRPSGSGVSTTGMGKAYAGGMVGFGVTSSVTKSYAKGACNAYSDIPSCYAAGIVGAFSFGSITNSVALNSVVSGFSNGGSTQSNAGRISSVYSGTFASNLALEDMILKSNDSILTPKDDPNYKDGGSTSAFLLETPAPYTELGWDFENVWEFATEKYPSLRWEAEVFVAKFPEIVAQPESVEANIGDTVSFKVDATGGLLSYIWMHEDEILPDENAATLLLEDIQPEDAGTYTVYVFNSKGGVLSDPATLGMGAAPTITTQPQGGIFYVGEPFELSVEAIGMAPLSYQWYKDGFSIAGATQPRFAVEEAQFTDSGVYTVRVSNTVGSVNSDDAKVTIRVVPPVSHVELKNPVLVEQEGVLYFIFDVEGASVFKVEGTKDGISWSPAEYTLTAEGHVKIPANQDYIYYRALAEAGPVVVAPEITVQPVGGEVYVGESLTLSVTAVGTEPLSYQWSKGGEAIEGANQATLELTHVTLENAGHYTVTVSNDGGSVTSSEAVVVVKTRPPVAEIELKNPVLVEQEGVLYFIFDVEGATVFKVEGTQDGISWSPAEYTLTAEGHVKIPANQDYIYYRALAEAGPVVVAPEITVQPVGGEVYVGESLTLGVTAVGTEPLSYQWSRGGEAIAGANQATLELANVTLENAGHYTVTVSNEGGSVTSVEAVVVVKTRPPVAEIELKNPVLVEQEGVLYFIFDVEGASVFKVEGTQDGISWSPAEYTLTAEGHVKIPANQDYIYYRALAEAGPVVVAPEITVQPVGGELYVGESLTLSVTAVGTEPLSYQWSKGGEAIAGANQATLELTHVTLGDAGRYTVTVSNEGGSVTSSEAVVVVKTRPPVTGIELTNPVSKGGFFFFDVETAGGVSLDSLQVWSSSNGLDWVLVEAQDVQVTGTRVRVPFPKGVGLYKASLAL